MTYQEPVPTCFRLKKGHDAVNAGGTASAADGLTAIRIVATARVVRLVENHAGRNRLGTPGGTKVVPKVFKGRRGEHVDNEVQFPASEFAASTRCQHGDGFLLTGKIFRRNSDGRHPIGEDQACRAVWRVDDADPISSFVQPCNHLGPRLRCARLNRQNNRQSFHRADGDHIVRGPS